MKIVSRNAEVNDCVSGGSDGREGHNRENKILFENVKVITNRQMVGRNMMFKALSGGTEENEESIIGNQRKEGALGFFWCFVLFRFAFQGGMWRFPGSRLNQSCNCPPQPQPQPQPQQRRILATSATYTTAQAVLDP